MSLIKNASFASAVLVAASVGVAAPVPFTTSFEPGQEQFLGLPGAVVTTINDPNNPDAAPYEGSHAYFLESNQVVNFDFGQGRWLGTLTIAVYDLGNIIPPNSEDPDYTGSQPNNSQFNQRGPRWGLTTTGASGSPVVGSSFEARTFYPSHLNTGFARGHSDNNPSNTGTWFTVASSAQLSRQHNQWTLWEITLLETGIEFRITRENETTGFLAQTYQGGDWPDGQGAAGLYLYGGNSQLSGVYFDAITWVPIPEPAALGLLAVGSVLTLRRRRA